MLLLFWRIRYLGTENVPSSGPVLILGNHQSYLDPPIIGAGLDRQLCYVARDTLFNNRFFAWLIDSINVMPIKRGTADIGAMKMIIEKLNSDEAVVLFPEATRSCDGNIAEIKPGFGLLAKRSRATVVPAIIDGAFEAWPRHKHLPGLGSINVQYGKPIQPDHVRALSNEEFAAEITTILRQMQSQLRSSLGKPPFPPAKTDKAIANTPPTI